MLMEFLDTIPGTVLMVLAVVMVLAYLWAKGHKAVVRKIVYSLVIQAERALGNGTGEFKYALVVGWVYERLPALVRLFLSEAELDGMIEAAVQYMKEELAESPKLNESFTAQLPN
jgi:hypothetical protein